MRFIFYSIITIIIISCTNSTTEKNEEKHSLFSKIPASKSNIHFSNKVEESLSFNFLNYPYIYNGGGVAVIDINQDGLEDIYFTSNQESNKLYINKGNFIFEDITEKALVSDDTGWTTGVSIVDINQDSWPDLYVCKSGELRNSDKRKNKLFINQKDGTFIEAAKEYGLDHQGFSTQAYFFDFDTDGDLDMYLVNHRPDFRNNTIIETEPSKIPEMSDQLFRNDNLQFVNITQQSGITNSAWGLSASIGDFNSDGYPDVFVANDFLQPDYLYINNKNGTFTDSSLEYFNHISANSMGSDFADIDNDLLPDLLVLDMMAADHKRSKKNMATMSTSNFNELVAAGYHYQYMSNVLQLNRNGNSFSEIGQLAGISKTDWSWAPLIEDFNNDGYKDIFITNGIENDLSNQDFRQQLQSNIKNKKKVTLQEALNLMPSEKLHNYFYTNNKNLSFNEESLISGFKEKINSNGAAYADLDNDGDLDLIVNNQSETASIYRNNSQNNYLKIKLSGSNKNSSGNGTQLILYTQNTQQLKIQNPTRGYQSSVSNKIIFGLDTIQTIDSLKIIWADGSTETQKNIAVNTTLHLQYHETKTKTTKKIQTPIFKEITPTDLGIDYHHFENSFNDYSLQVLLPQKQSTQSAPIAIADVNNDGLEDIFLGNGFDQEATLYIQNKKGKFTKKTNNLFKRHAKYEDQKALFFDADSDGDLDLYVSSGGYELHENSELLQDRLYINDGIGNFKSGKLPRMLSSTKSISVADIDGDNDLDLFVGGRVIPGKYPLAPKSYLLENNNGKFTDITTTTSSELSDFGMINETVFSDFDNDGDKDLLIACEWKPITIFENKNANFTKYKNSEFESYIGWFQSIKAYDIDNDGDEDYLIGNFGKNNKYHPTSKKPLHIYADYFDANTSFDIILSKDLNGELVPVRGKQCSTEQTPFLGKKIATFDQFANSTLKDIYGKEKLENALHLTVNTFDSFLLENLGNKKFLKKSFPNECQFGPTLDFTLYNNNRNKQIIGIGNLFEAEVETIRYDANKGYTIRTDSLESSLTQHFSNLGNAKAIEQIQIDKTLYFIVMNNNSKLSMYKVTE